MRLRAILLVLAVLAAACGGGETTASGPEVLGEQLFNSMVVGGKAGCLSCHSTYPDDDGIGPTLAGMASVAGTRVDGQAAADYVRRSITDPDAYVVEGFETGVMPAGWNLSETQIDSLVEYILNLK